MRTRCRAVRRHRGQPVDVADDPVPALLERLARPARRTGGSATPATARGERARRGSARHPPSRGSAGWRARRRRPPRGRPPGGRTCSSSRSSTRGPVSSTSRSRARPKGSASAAQPVGHEEGAGHLRSSGRNSENDERSRRMPTRVWCRCGIARDCSRSAALVRQWSVHSVATTTNACGCRGRRVERDRARLARLGIGAEVDRRRHRAGQDADGAGHIGSAVVVGTGASVVNFGPSARSTVTTLRLSLTSAVPLGSEVRSSLAWAAPLAPYRISATFGALRLGGVVGDLADDEAALVQAPGDRPGEARRGSRRCRR